MAALHDLSAIEQARALADGEFTCVELTTHYLERIDRWSAIVGAFVTVTAEQALAAARRTDADAAAGAERPALWGVPTAIKDLTAVAGVPLRLGTAALDPAVPDYDDDVVTRLRGAGMVLLGKTNTPEFGLPLYTEPDIAPPARSPWALDHSAGGSSGGAAVAVAAGLVPVAHGTDGGGSIRTPASICGLVGLKPSRGLIPIGPRQVEGAGLGVHGFLARTVADAAILLDCAAGGSVHERLHRDLGRLRIGRHRAPTLADIVPHPVVVDAFNDVSRLLEQLGHDVVDVDPPFGRDVVADFETVWAVGAATVPVPDERQSLLRPLTQWLRGLGRRHSAVDYVTALSRLQRAARDAVAATAAYDAVLVPTLADLPKMVGEMCDDDDPAADFAAQERFNPYSAAYNMTGQPAITVPVHWTEDDIPVGMQLVGRPAGEGVLLALATQLEEARPWRHRTPPQW